jgi:1-deoxy-D-xylulose-5-phosphate synthase
MSMLQIVPGLRIAAPRDGSQLRAQLREALEVSDAPTVLRIPKGAVCDDIPAVGRLGGVDLLRTPTEAGLAPDVLVVGVGAMAGVALDVADRLAAQGIGATVADPRWVKPVDPALVELAARHRLVVTVEDNSRVGGVGAAVAQALRDDDVRTPLRDYGIPPEFFDHAKRAVLLERLGLSGQRIAHEIVGLVAGLGRGTAQNGGSESGVAANQNGVATNQNGVGTAAVGGQNGAKSAPKVTAR